MATTWNPADKHASVTLSGGNLVATETTGNGRGVRATASKTTGQWYFQVTVNTAGCMIGVANSSYTLNNFLFSEGAGLGYSSSGDVRHSGSIVGTGSPASFTVGDVIGVAMDMDTGTIKFYKNAVLQCTVSGADVPSGALFPAFSGAGTVNAAMTANFSPAPASLPAGFSAFDLTDVVHVMTGGVSVGGSAAVSAPTVHTTTGGVSVGGTALVAITSATLHTMTGGAKVGGDALVEIININQYRIADEGLPYGGMVLGGSADVRDNLVVVPTGGMTLGGSAVVQERIPFLPSGGMVMGGAVALAFVSAPPVSGGMIMSGAPAISYVAREVSVGGMVMGGSPTIQFRESLFVASGGMVLGGSALAYFVPSHITVTPENPYADEFPGWAVNMETNAATRYLGLAANSITQFMGRTFVANAAGVYEIGADTDAGQPINASIQFPTTDYGESREKRMEVAYIGLKTQGRMRLKVTVNDKKPYYYAILPTSKTPKGARIPIGKGLHGRYWTSRLDNVSGADFELESIEFVPYIGQRHGA